MTDIVPIDARARAKWKLYLQLVTKGRVPSGAIDQVQLEPEELLRLRADPKLAAEEVEVLRGTKLVMRDAMYAAGLGGNVEAMKLYLAYVREPDPTLMALAEEIEASVR